VSDWDSRKQSTNSPYPVALDSNALYSVAPLNRWSRREFLAVAGASAFAERGFSQALKPDITLRISPVTIEIAPGHIIKTTGYNGSAPGPVLRVREGQPVLIEVHNDTPIPELVHWHGLQIPSEVDGAAEEGTPFIPPHASARYSFIPKPSGTRWYHTHVSAGRDLKRATYTGQYGFLYIEPKQEPDAFDAEFFLALHGWDPFMSTMGGDEGGLEVAYKRHSINSHALGSGEPLRVKEGQRVMLRILNASATMLHRLALPGHKFRVVALDGNPVSTPCDVEVLELGPAERIDAIVTMDHPGVWILGEPDDHMRAAGLGAVVEYAGRSGEPEWSKPGGAASVAPWDYTQFGEGRFSNRGPRPEAEIVPLVFKQKFAGNRWVDHWTINGKEFPKTDPIRVTTGRRYRLAFDNQSDEAHPVHLHRHSFELTKFAGIPVSGVMKDVVMVPARKQVEVDFIADNPGPTLFHCHQQMHMDYGFMAMVEYAGYRAPAMRHDHSE
jgi:FtsP/CotA-like multicopper oxidase with cupredoxin domain